MKIEICNTKNTRKCQKQPQEYQGMHEHTNSKDGFEKQKIPTNTKTIPKTSKEHETLLIENENLKYKNKQQRPKTTPQKYQRIEEHTNLQEKYPEISKHTEYQRIQKHKLKT